MTMNTLATLRNKRCFVTGGSRGIGFAIAQAFARAGASCVLVARDPVRLNESLSSIRKLAPELNHSAISGNVGEADFWKGVVKTEPDIDILVNAAGLSTPSLLASTSYESIDRTIQTNLLGSIYGCKVYARLMMKRKEGFILNISSVLGIKGGKGDVVYSASKAGILGLTRSLAVEVARYNVRVNAICPGYIETDMTKGINDAERERIRVQTPLQRFGQADEVASVAFLLATNKFSTGSIVNVDGGLSI